MHRSRTTRNPQLQNRVRTKKTKMINTRRSAATPPLHQYLRQMWPSVDVVKDLLRDDPSMVTMKDQLGHTSLHLSTRMDVCPEITRILLEAAPEALDVKDDTGETPLSRLCEWWTFAVPTNWRHETKIHCGLNSDTEETLKLHPLDAQWEKIILMLKVASENLSRIFFRPLQTAAYMGCPPMVLRHLHALNSSQIAERQEETGRRPLSIAAASPHVCGKEGLATLEGLLYLDPSAAKAPDHEGRFPLHLAIESGKTWNTGIKSLAIAAPSVLLEHDSKTQLLPFMASSEKGFINDAYHLLRYCPEVIKYEVDRNSTYNRKPQDDEQIPVLSREDCEVDEFIKKLDSPVLIEPRALKRKIIDFDESSNLAKKRVKNMKHFAICCQLEKDRENLSKR